MIKSGEYKTKGGFRAIVESANKNGFIGWIDSGLCCTPEAWDENGIAYSFNEEHFDLDLPRPITIPETELPEPFYINTLTRTTHVNENTGEVRMVSLHFSVELQTSEAAEQWAEWWKRIMKGDE